MGFNGKNEKQARKNRETHPTSNLHQRKPKDRGGRSQEGGSIFCDSET